MTNANDDGMKSAYELALERLDQRGIERPREAAVSEAARAAIAEARAKAKARRAELEIFHRERLAKLRDPAEKHQEEQDFQTELARIESDCERQVERARDAR